MVKEISQSMLENVYKGGFISCKYIHKHSCERNVWLKFRSVFWAANRFYIPIHLIPVLLFKRKRIFTE